MTTSPLALRDADFGELAGFELAWRFAAGRSSLLAPQLSKIRPLVAQAAQRVHDFAVSVHTEEGLAVPTLAKLDTADLPEQSVTDWLDALDLGAADDVVIVSWNKQTAIATPLELFVSNWSDFCYPASDDATVLPIDLRWVLAYFHEEEFWYGLRRDA